ncbi:unnamed protein product [Musa acuminata var. zebrina]
MENMYMWVFKKRPENALGKMQLRSYMNGHSRLGVPQFPFSIDKGFVRSHRMQRKHYRGLSNPLCIHGIEVVWSPNLLVVPEVDLKKWLELTGRDLNFSIPPEAGDFGAWRNLPSTDFELERPPPPLKSTSHTNSRKLLNDTGLKLSTQPSNHACGDSMDLSPKYSKRRKEFSPHDTDEDCCLSSYSYLDRPEIHPAVPSWVNEFTGAMRHACGPVTAAKTIYEDEGGYLIMVSLPFSDQQKVKVSWKNNLTHGFVREIPLATRIPEDAKLEAYYDETGTLLEIMIPKYRVGPEEHEVHVSMHPPHLGSNELLVEGLLYTLADAAVATDATAAAPDASTAVQKNGGWFGFISDAMEVVLKVLKDGLTAIHVPYSYGFAIILLTIIVKVLTLPLTKKQVESTLAMQNLQPKIKAIQERYAGNQERIQLETARLYRQAGVNPLAGCFPTLATIPVWIGLYQALSNVANEGLLTEGFFWIPSLGGPTTIAARQSGSGISWLIPFVDGHPPLGWFDTAAYLVLPVLLVVSQYVSMEIMKPPQTNDPATKNSLLVFKFLPLMIGYFALSVPSGLSIYWFTNNVLSTAQQIWLRKLGGAKPVVSGDAGGIISAGRAKRSASQPERTGERFKQLKEQENRKMLNKELPIEEGQGLASTSNADDESDGESIDKGEVLEETYASNESKKLPQYNTTPKKGKRSKRKRVVQ